jgi:hypothetical protein
LQHFTAAVDMHDGNALIEQLRQFARPGPTDAPRNAPCPSKTPASARS